MRFEELHNTIPLAKGGKEKVLRYSPYPNVTLAMPGRHADETVPKGGDFVVMVTDPIFAIPDHQFTHTDIFKQVEKISKLPAYAEQVMRRYLDIIQGADPTAWDIKNMDRDCILPNTFLAACQCLAVAEHRRYAQFEPKWGGRYLPFRFAAGIAEGLWSAADAANLQKKGRIGVEILEKTHGVPAFTKELMK
jgi:hypothetical protein